MSTVAASRKSSAHGVLRREINRSFSVIEVVLLAANTGLEAAQSVASQTSRALFGMLLDIVPHLYSIK
jgi:hypothetical protein